MAYVSVWERLPDALMRVRQATGLSSEEAQIDICRAILDRTVEFRGTLKKHTTKLITSSAILEGHEFQLPTHLDPKDLDWKESRPLKSWIVKRGRFSPAGHWNIERIEISRIDLMNILCAGKEDAAGVAAQPTSIKSAAGPKRRIRPALERARGIISSLYPQGAPGQANEPNKKLCARVGEELKKQGLPNISDDTILRAAGRRT